LFYETPCTNRVNEHSDIEKGIIVKLPIRTTSPQQLEGNRLVIIANWQCSYQRVSQQTTRRCGSNLHDEQPGSTIVYEADVCFVSAVSTAERRPSAGPSHKLIDFKKVSDSVHRLSLWKILEHYSIP